MFVCHSQLESVGVSCEAAKNGKNVLVEIKRSLQFDFTVTSKKTQRQTYQKRPLLTMRVAFSYCKRGNMNTLVQLGNEIAQLELKADTLIGQDFSSEDIQYWQQKMQLLQMKLAHEEVTQLKIIANMMMAYHELGVKNAVEQQRQIDAMETRMSSFEAVLDEKLLHAIQDMERETKAYPEQRAFAPNPFTTAYVDSDSFNQREDIK